MKYYNIVRAMLVLTLSTALAGCGTADKTADNGNSADITVGSSITEEATLTTEHQAESEISIAEEVTNVNSMESDVQTSKDESSSEAEIEETKPLKPREYFPSLSEETLGNRKDFAAELENKLTTILGSDDFIFFMTDGPNYHGDDECWYSYEFKYDALNLNGDFGLCESKKNPGYLTVVSCYMKGGVWDAKYDRYTGENALPTFWNNRVYKTCLCAALSPLAVLENYNSQEEILTRFEDFDGKRKLSKLLKAYPDTDYISGIINDEYINWGEDWAELNTEFYHGKYRIALDQGQSYGDDNSASSSFEIKHDEKNVWEEED